MILSECKRDGFPLAIINGRRQCVAEFLNQCLGFKKVTDVIRRDDTLFYVFEDGHELPLLCYCCNSPLGCDDLSAERERIIGLYLKSMTWDIAMLEKREIIDFRLELASPIDKNTILQVQTSVMSADKLIHPATCINNKKAPPVIEPAPYRKRRKRR